MSFEEEFIELKDKEMTREDIENCGEGEKIFHENIISAHLLSKSKTQEAINQAFAYGSTRSRQEICDILEGKLGLNK